MPLPSSNPIHSFLPRIKVHVNLFVITFSKVWKPNFVNVPHSYNSQSDCRKELNNCYIFDQVFTNNKLQPQHLARRTETNLKIFPQKLPYCSFVGRTDNCEVKVYRGITVFVNIVISILVEGSRMFKIGICLVAYLH